MFPGANANIYRNEEGEVLGWDTPSYDEPEYDEGDPVEDDPDEEDYPEGMGHRQDTWPDLDDRCEDLIKQAFTILNQAPGQRDAYARVQALCAEAIRILRGME